ncbi:MAG: diaminopimelate epimerase, partial [bacterium]
MSQINFIKMQGTGNDFIMVNGYNYSFNNLSDIVKRVCNRHFGIGGDGLILLLPPEDIKNDYKMRIFNSNGSEAEMCGNGIRCIAHFIIENDINNKKSYKIETLAGLITPEIIEYNKRKSMVKVNMGIPVFDSENIPININEPKEYIENYKLEINDNIYKINCVSMGNPHSIIFVDNIRMYNLKEIGPLIENNPIFPEKTNVEFIEIINKNEIKMKVWERGVGITLACGTGATASVVAGIKNNLLNDNVLVHLPGGDLQIEWNGGSAFMTGPAETIFKGSINL